MITYTYRFKIKPTACQIKQFEQYLSVCRSVYNYAHAERKAWLESRKSLLDRCSIHSEYIIPADTPFPSYYNQSKALTLAKTEFPHLKLVNAQCLQQTLKRLDRAWVNFFEQPKRGFPKFKNANRFRSFVFPQPLKNCLDSNRVKLPTIGWIRIRQSRPYPEGFKPKQFHVVRKASGYYLMIVFQSPEVVPDAIPGKTSIGIDAGIESFIATPTELIKSPKFLTHQARKLKLLQRRLKKKTQGSNNWLKLQKRIARIHEKVARTRRDWHFKLAHYICDKADNIFVEDIDFTSWSKGLYRKQSLDSGIGGFINRVLPRVCFKRGKFYLKVDRNFSSQECPQCNRRTGKKKLSQRRHCCQFCGHTEPRDTASAKIIQQRGESAVGHTVQQDKLAEARGISCLRSSISAPQNACGDDATGFIQLSLFELVGN